MALLSRLAAATALLFSVTNTFGQSYDYSIFAEALKSDNIQQASSNLNLGADPQSGNIYEGGIRFDLANTPNATFAFAADGEFSRTKYQVENLEPEDNKRLNASLIFQPSNINFSLSILDQLRQVSANRQATQQVNNLSDVNVFSIVPAYFINLTSASRIDLNYRYSDIEEEQNLNSRTIGSSTVAYRRQVNQYTSWSVNAVDSHTEFKDTEFEFDQQSVFFRWQHTGDVTNYNLDFGRQRVLGEDNADDVYQTYVGVSLNREINTFSDLELQYFQGYSDAVNVDVSNTITQTSANDQAAFVQGLVRETQASVIYNYTNRNFTSRWQAQTRDLESEDDFAGNIGNIDENRDSVQVDFEYRFTTAQSPSRFGIQLSYFYETSEFHINDVETKIGEGRIRFNYFPTPKLTTYLQVVERNTSGTGPQSDTDETRYIFGIEFAPRK